MLTTAPVIQTSLVVQTFFFRMQEYPEIQIQAQTELDEIVGRGRLPSFSDKPNLPFLDALCKELLRHNTAFPAGTNLSHSMVIETRLTCIRS